MFEKLKKHILHIFSAFYFSLQGVWFGVRTETAFKQEAAGLVVLPLLARLIGFRVNAILAIIIGWLVVMACEMLNVAVESICNLVSPEYNILVKRAKDTASASILLTLIANGLLWIILCAAHFGWW